MRAGAVMLGAALALPGCASSRVADSAAFQEPSVQPIGAVPSPAPEYRRRNSPSSCDKPDLTQPVTVPDLGRSASFSDALIPRDGKAMVSNAATLPRLNQVHGKIYVLTWNWICVAALEFARPR